MGISDELIKAGLTNHYSEDIGALAYGKKKEEFFNYCTSIKCCTYLTSLKSGKVIKRHHARVLKDVKGNTCPDCGGVLIIRKGLKP